MPSPPTEPHPLAAAPWDYPGTPGPAAPAPLDREGLTPVLAYGSNADPRVLAAKLGASVPVSQVEVTGVSVGVSAHVSRLGYLPAALRTGRGRLRTRVAWLRAHQLADLDATEPTYRRVTLCPTTHPAGLAGLQAYESLAGVLPGPAGDQREVWRVLHEEAALRALTGHPAGGDVRPLLLRLGRDPSLRAAVSAWLASRATSSGLALGGAGGR